ncbi:glycosyltransferase [Acaryochloris sp. IP29b_bin.148]|uniref:glycosyltransferase family 2 protein n=1 Tax=Acaryochloris sp. IP29b_bin.148 TaxID=2969218 RepID=UPI002621EBE5|nr:glycosyltransferase [Acaryochloris sp. IP29b_bin.148]
MFFSVIIPTYNRLPILQKCLHALSYQALAAHHTYEVIVVDDGSTDDTVAWLQHQAWPVRYICQAHQGAAIARNLGIQASQGDTFVFIDSDLVVTEQFLQAHAHGLEQAQHRLRHDRLFSYGRVIQTCNFETPTAEPYKITDFSAAYFATGNVAITRHWLDVAGGFDPRFKEYGWEDLELGMRLKRLGLVLVKTPKAVGYHWHPPFSLDQLPQLIEQEQQRGRMGMQFYLKHPTAPVRRMIQMTLGHRLLWGMLTANGWLNEHTLSSLLQFLINRHHSQMALGIARIFLNWYQVQSAYAAYMQLINRDVSDNG